MPKKDGPMPDKVSRGKKRGELPTKICLQCQRPFN